MRTGAIGLDAGSTTAKLVVCDREGVVTLRRTARHHGRPVELARAWVAEARALAGPTPAIGVTGSAGLALAAELEATPVHEVSAVARAVRGIRPDARTLIELGGQDAKLVWIDERGGDSEMNDRCAAGTGATIDRIARRIGISEEALRALPLEGDARVAAKCGVFAETDVVNLIQQGVSPAIAMAALARAIVVQNLAVLARGRAVRPPVVLLGGPHAHLPFLATAWREALAELWSRRGIAPGEVIVPEHADTLAALGAALHARDGGPPLALVHGVLGEPRCGPTLAGDRSLLEELPPTAPRPALRRRAWLGLDAGSTSTKAALLDDDGAVLASSYGLSTGDPIADARIRIAELLRVAPGPVAGLAVTGYGAEIAGEVLGADRAILETLAHARAAEHALPGVEVIVDVGGTDVKVMRLREGWPVSFHLSSQCSAGHGAFLATAAAELGVPMESYAEQALAARRAPEFTVGCAIFLDTDRVTFQRDGHAPAEILAGLARALPRNVWEMIVGEPPAHLGRTFLLTGGAHQNLAVALAHAEYLRARVPGARVARHPMPGLCGAIGAALALRHEAPASPRFRGLEASARARVRVESGDATRCDRCELACSRALVHVRASEQSEERTLVLGNACERGADAGSSGRRGRGHAIDLLAEEGRRLFTEILPVPARRRLARPPVIGIPRVMALYRCAPFLLHYLRAAGVPSSHLELSPPTSPALFHEGARWAANDPCFPAKLVPAHVDWLLRRHRERPLDAILLPTFTHAAIPVRGTEDTASCPIVAGCGHAAFASMRRGGDRFAAAGVRAMSPVLAMTDPGALDRQMRAAFDELLELDDDSHRAALAHALAAQAEHGARLRRRGETVLARARREGRAVAVILARPYHADPGVQHGISTELAARGIPVLGVSSLPLGDGSDLDVSGLLADATNSGCAERVWAARRVASDPSLVAVDLSSFRCGQDASVQGVIDDLLGDAKPVLRLHDVDEHRPGITMQLRIATFAAAVQRHARTLVPVETRP